MNSDFARPFAVTLCAALVLCGGAAGVCFAVLDGLRRMAAGAFHAGLTEALASVAVAAAALVLAWRRTAHLITDAEGGDAPGT